jgi:hypothetical protein
VRLVRSDRAAAAAAGGARVHGPRILKRRRQQAAAAAAAAAAVQVILSVRCIHDIHKLLTDKRKIHGRIKRAVDDANGQYTRASCYQRRAGKKRWRTDTQRAACEGRERP